MTCKSFISTVMAAAVALTAFSAAPTPARADSDAAKIIFGATALGIIAAGIAEANDNDHGYVSQHGHYYQYKNYQPRHHRHVRHKHYQQRKYYQHRKYRNHYRNGYRHGYRDGYRRNHYDRPFNNRRNW